MFRYCGVIAQVILARGLGRLDRGGDLLHQRAEFGQALSLEVPKNELQVSFGRSSNQLIDVDEAFAVTGRFRGSRDVGQRVDDLGREMQRVDHRVLGPARMGRHPP